MEVIEEIIESLKNKGHNITKKDGVYELSYKNDELTYMSFKIRVEKIIYPTREGELIDDILGLPIDKEYSLSYPGTASTKCMVLYTGFNDGIFIGGVPSVEYAKIGIRKLKEKLIRVSYYGKENTLYFIPFKHEWKTAADKYKEILGIKSKPVPPRKPKYFLQIGVIDPQGKYYINDFMDLMKPVEYFAKELGTEHIIHLFGTNKDGFDRMYPDYTISDKIGGEKSLQKFLKEIKSMGFLTSHHYNPRISDVNWVKENPEYQDAVIKDETGNAVMELYKEHPFYMMNPNNQKWFDRAMQTVYYLDEMGFDYIELDQFTYQRNFYIPGEPALHIGYQKMMDLCQKKGIKYWLEGVSDAVTMKPGNFAQILVRDRPQVWESHENRRGYPYGTSFPYFYMHLYPDAEVSYQIITEDRVTEKCIEKLAIAKSINAAVYDLQMDFYTEKYMHLLETVVRLVKSVVK
jgi:hypothetical protein